MVIITVAPTEPMAGEQYELTGSIANRSNNLEAFKTAIALEVGLDPAAVEVSGTDVLVEDVVRYTLADGLPIDRPFNKWLATHVRHFLNVYPGDIDTGVLQVFRACIRYGKRKRGMTRNAITNLAGQIYDAIASDDD